MKHRTYGNDMTKNDITISKLAGGWILVEPNETVLASLKFLICINSLGADATVIEDRPDGRYCYTCNTMERCYHTDILVHRTMIFDQALSPPPSNAHGPPTQRHPSSQRFHDILRELGELHDRKQADYGTPTDPFANIRASMEYGISPVLGAILRANDKVSRIKTWIKKGSLANESIRDSLKDNAVYNIIAHVLLDEQESGSDPGRRLYEPRKPLDRSDDAMSKGDSEIDGTPT